MLETIAEFLSGLNPRNREKRPDADDPDVAAVALFFHVIGADGVVRDEEQAMLKTLVRDFYGRHGSDMRDLLHEGEQADRESVDLFSFTSVLNRSLDETQKVQFVGLLWQLAYADGHRHELEDHVVWRIADLLGVSTRDRVLARQEAETRLGHESGGHESGGDE